MLARLTFLILFLASSIRAAEPVRFIAVDVVLDPKGQPLAAYQIEIQAEPGVKIVGVEGGEHPEFRKAPHYDPSAIQTERLVAAAFTTAGSDKLPTSVTRILTLHLQTTNASAPQLQANLKLAAQPNAQKIKAQVTLKERIPQ